VSARGAITEVPYVPEVRIERDADALIAEYAHRTGTPVAGPVPVEDILELHLGLTFAIEDLAALFGTDARDGDDVVDDARTPPLRKRFHRPG